MVTTHKKPVKKKPPRVKSPGARIYTYGALAPTLNTENIEKQFKLAHRYRNSLVAVERHRRQKSEQILFRYHPALAAETAIVQSMVTAIYAKTNSIKARNQAAQQSTITEEEKTELAEARKQLNASSKPLQAARKLAWKNPAMRLELDIVAAKAKRAQQRRNIIARFGLYWGNYLTVEDSMRFAHQGAPPKFRRWEEGGTVSVQLQKGLTSERAFSTADTRMQLMPKPGAANSQHYVGKLRIGSLGRDPIWVEFPFKLHRPLPAGSQIKWARLFKRQVAYHAEWELQITVQGGEYPEREERATAGTVAIDVGWRLLDAGLRVAYCVGDDGREEELILPAEDVERWRYADTLRGYRDRHFNNAKAWLHAWVTGQPMPVLPNTTIAREQQRLRQAIDGTTQQDRRERLSRQLQELQTLVDTWTADQPAADDPPALATHLAYLPQWKEAKRLAGAIEQWREHRFFGDEAMFAVMSSWATTDKHLWEWEANQRLRAVRWRKDVYRNFAKRLSRNYATAVIEDAKWTQLMLKPDPDDVDATDVFNPTARYLQRVAAVGDLLTCIKEAMRVTRKAPTKNTTRTCHKCQNVETFDAAANLLHTCSKCGAVWDQDFNAGNVLLQWHAANA